MRMGSFFMGGIVGVATAMYLSRKFRDGAMLSMIPKMSKMTDNRTKSSSDPSDHQSQDQSNSSSSSHTADRQSGLEQVADLASKDTSVLSEVNKILEESNQDHIQPH